MRSKKLRLIAVLASLEALVCSPLSGPQQDKRRPISEVRPYTSIDDILDREAGSSDSAEVRQFSEDLTSLLIPERVGDEYIESFATRLANAEQLARSGKGKLVPEAEVVQVFNSTMRRIDAPFRTDEATVRRFRDHSIAVPSLSALLTADRNGTKCSPAEAVYLLYLLSWFNGDLPVSVLDREAQLKHLESQGEAPVRVMGVGTGLSYENASRMLTSYSSHHNRRATKKLFNDMLRAFGF
jgi:hypothetical protein